MSDALELADQLWRGEREITDHHPFSPTNSITEAADRVAFVDSLANVSAFATDDGLAMVDTGSVFMARTLHETIRTWNGAPLRAAVYSHGHIDHVFGVPVFEEEARANGWPEPKVVAHEALPARFDRYVMTAGYNAVINQRQFQAPGLRWPTEYRYPDETYRERHHVDVGGLRLHLHHAKGETDDHTWTWVPDRRVLCCGDLFIWCSPNAGNPQKVQRYPREWAVALREMAELGAEVMLPGHGLPVAGADRVRTALLDTAALLESLLEQTLGMMNEGARLDDVLHSVRAPAELLDKPYLRPIYDEPEFVVRNIWRLYGGWYDGNPARLKPAPDARLAGPGAGRGRRRAVAAPRLPPRRARRPGCPRRRRGPRGPGGRLRATARGGDVDDGPGRVHLGRHRLTAARSGRLVVVAGLKRRPPPTRGAPPCATDRRHRGRRR
jgi:glyoxylase-like metal-dependent hydrolase (beta-lactamase superfamily II)